MNQFQTIFYACLFISIFSVNNSLAAIVDSELVLLVDVSGSVNSVEYTLQKDGYANAFRSGEVIDVIESVGSIAVTYVEWSGASQQAQLVGWTMINNSESSNSFADLIDQTVRAYSGMTAPGSAISYGVSLIGLETGGADNGYESTRQVIDISGDGKRNSGENTSAARNTALASGVDQINGLPIGNSTIANYYDNNVIGGEGSFFMAAYQFADIQDSLVSKLGGDITGVVPENANVLPPASNPPADIPAVPLPAAGWLFGLALVGMATMGRDRNIAGR